MNFVENLLKRERARLQAQIYETKMNKDTVPPEDVNSHSGINRGINLLEDRIKQIDKALDGINSNNSR